MSNVNNIAVILSICAYVVAYLCIDWLISVIGNRLCDVYNLRFLRILLDHRDCFIPYILLTCTMVRLIIDDIMI